MLLKPDPDHQLSRDALHAISTEFLASEKLAHAPLAEKKEFLKTKGLSEDEIETLLQKSVAQAKGKEAAVDSEVSSEASSSRVPTPTSSDAGEEQENKNGEKGLVPKELKEVLAIHLPIPHLTRVPLLTPTTDSPLPSTLSKAQTQPYRAHPPSAAPHRNLPRISCSSTAAPRPHHGQIPP